MKKIFCWLITILLAGLTACAPKFSAPASEPSQVAPNVTNPASEETDVPALNATANPTPTPDIPVSTIPGKWTIQYQYSPSQISGNNALYGIWGSSANDIFAVGNPGVLHYDGKGWALMNTEPIGFRAVWGSSARDVYAVGNGIEHYDGSKWSTVKPPTARLNAVWGSSSTDIFAVGLEETINPFSFNEVVLHYDGTDWTKMITPRDSMNGSTLSSVWGNSPSDVFAAGNGVILHYDGRSWSSLNWKPANLVLNPEVWATMIFNGIWGTSPSDVYVSGTANDVNHFKPVLLHYDGKAWNAMSGISDIFFSIWGTSSTDFYLGGLMRGGAVPTAYYGVIQHYDGTNWNRQVVPNSPIAAPAYSVRVFGIWGSSANDIFAVNDYGDILHYSGQQSNATANEAIPGQVLSDLPVYPGSVNRTSALYPGYQPPALPTSRPVYRTDQNKPQFTAASNYFRVNASGGDILSWYLTQLIRDDYRRENEFQASSGPDGFASHTITFYRTSQPFVTVEVEVYTLTNDPGYSTIALSVFNMMSVPMPAEEKLPSDINGLELTVNPGQSGEITQNITDSQALGDIVNMFNSLTLPPDYVYLGPIGAKNVILFHLDFHSASKGDILVDYVGGYDQTGVHIGNYPILEDYRGLFQELLNRILGLPATLP